MKRISKIGNQSAEYARGRTKVLLTSERIHCSQQKINLLKKDLISTVKRYFKVEEEQVTIEISQEPFLIHVKIPVGKIRNEDL